MSILHSPHNSLKGKTIKSFKSTGYAKGYILKCTDGTQFNIESAGFPSTVYVEKIN